MQLNEYNIWNENLWFNSFVADGDKAWFSADNFNGLFELNLNTFETKFLGVFPNEGLEEIGLYFNVIKCDDYLVFAPASAKEIAVYDISKAEFNKIPILPPKKLFNRYNVGNKFFGMTIYQKYVFIIADYYPAILRLDLRKNEVLYLDQWVEEVESISVVQDRKYFRKDICSVEKKIYLACCITNAVLEFNMDTLEYKLNRIGDNKVQFRSVCYAEGNFWVSLWNKCILMRWDGISNKAEVFKNPYLNDVLDGEYNTASLFFYEGNIWNIAINSDQAYKFNVSSEKWILEDIFKNEKIKEYRTRHPWKHTFSFAYHHGHKLFLYSGKDMELIELDLKRRMKTMHPIVVTKKVYFERILAIVQEAREASDVFIMEDKQISLQEFIWAVCNDMGGIEDTIIPKLKHYNNNLAIGTNIYNKIIENL